MEVSRSKVQCNIGSTNAYAVDANAASTGKGVAAMEKMRVKQETGMNGELTTLCIQLADNKQTTI